MKTAEEWNSADFGQKPPRRTDCSAVPWPKVLFLHIQKCCFVHDCEPEHHNSISYSVFRADMAFTLPLHVGTAGLGMWRYANRWYDQYIMNRLMGNGADGCHLADDVRSSTYLITISHIFPRIKWITPLYLLGHQRSPQHLLAIVTHAAARTLISGMTSRPVWEAFKPVSD